ncbi:hypothetical protein SAMN05428953_12660 [Mesorhizobium muleiense]|uniref:Uncharacterized protein n=1 Tax=Mesorhizobium muleiense TaxID=1004279 RepID=A0A1G9H3S2_9HYPH|nr:hypothetical protein [Mesorhizobium muleiense]SDL07596.1 hypothetical protein SAMN05428953_12660 [Mesorhizobium muleiense]
MSGDLSEQLSPQEQSERNELVKAFREVAALAAGKRVLFWMLEQAAIYADPFAGENTNATNYTLGQQAVGRKLISKFDEIDPRLYPRLLLDIGELKAMDIAALAAKQETEDEE